MSRVVVPPASMSCSRPRCEFYLDLLLRLPCSSDPGRAANKYLVWICDIYHINDIREDESKGLDGPWGHSVFRYDVRSWPRTGFRIGVRTFRTVMLPFLSNGIASRVSFGAVAPGLLPVWTSSEG